MGSERAETYLRNLAESELRRLRGEPAEAIRLDLGRVRAAGAAFAYLRALDNDLAQAVVDDLATALQIRSEDGLAGLSFHMRPRVMSAAGRAASPPEAFSVTPVGALLELRDGETDMDVYSSRRSAPRAWCALARVSKACPRDHDLGGTDRHGPCRARRRGDSLAGQASRAYRTT